MTQPRKQAVALAPKAGATRKGYRTCSGCGKNRAERFFVGPRGRKCSTCRRKRVSHTSRGQRLLETYGITLDEYDQLLEAQCRRCEICGGERSYNLDVDHDHALERALIEEGVSPTLARYRSIRGLLCKQCNRRILRSVRDNPAILQAAIDYLKDPPAMHVLGTRLP